MRRNVFVFLWVVFSLIGAGCVGVRAADTVTNAAPRLVIVKAVYGDLSDANATADVTKHVAGMIKSNALSVVVGADNFEDPASGITKQLRVDFTIDGVSGSKNIYEYGTMKISVADKRDPNAKPSKLVIRKAIYGVMPDGETIDVTAILSGMVKDDVLTMKVNSDDLGDPAVGMG